ncbi:hypothetical protein J6590_092066, partial [Homalodisca vitripennis]
ILHSVFLVHAQHGVPWYREVIRWSIGVKPGLRYTKTSKSKSRTKALIASKPVFNDLIERPSNFQSVSPPTVQNHPCFHLGRGKSVVSRRKF